MLTQHISLSFHGKFRVNKLINNYFTVNTKSILRSTQRDDASFLSSMNTSEYKYKVLRTKESVTSMCRIASYHNDLRPYDQYFRRVTRIDLYRALYRYRDIIGTVLQSFPPC